MRIRAVELTNLRRFAGQRARIEGIGDGISVLAQPNEYGKSTFFDGLHALFFAPHRSQTAQIKALRPLAGGAPEAAVEIDLPEGRFRLEKRWLSRAIARVLDAAGRPVAQEDEAEAWIERLMGRGLAGPSGLLWVRQGLTGMEPEGAGAADRNDREQGLAARRDLLSSVAGEIELMTGGRRMDQIAARVRDALVALATGTGRPKSGGEWARAVDEAAALAAKRAELEDKAARLSGQLAERARIQRDLAQVADVAASARDEAALAAAEAALKAGEAHGEDIRKAEAGLSLARLTASQGKDGIDRLTGLQSRLTGAEVARDAAAADLAQVAALLADSAQAEAGAAARHDAARDAAAALAGRLEVAQRLRLALAARDRAASLAGELGRATRQRDRIEDHRAARAVLQVTPERVEQAEKAQAACDQLNMRAEARLVSLRIDYDGAARVLHDGRAVGAEGMRLRGATRLDLPGIGRMFIEPGVTGGDDIEARLAKARAVRERALAACGVRDLPAARAALAEAQRLDAAIAQAGALLQELAPDGLDALRARHAAALAEAGEAADTPPEDIDGLEAALRAAREAEAQAMAALREAEGRHATLRETHAARQAAAQAARQAADAARAEAGDPVDLRARIMVLAQAQPGLDAGVAGAETALQALRANAPDIATARAAAQRLRAVVDGRARDRERLGMALAQANGLIGGLADEGIEEALDELRGREATALERAARYEREVAALSRLRDALDQARHAAREAYFGPVLHELEPLLSIIHPGASLRIDDASLLPSVLTRDGQDEALDILSGGTREQIAVLTRLAFARLFARTGRPVPVILDDALVHSDDDRIEAMFTALHRVAQDQQIIVFTCRQRAFAALGGARIEARIEPV
ncbi:MAG: chromosome segregation protein SMC [Rubellimicrobium sp.]|nr:chromosome segregation protein SMC [Rubellimicrobium sp.]